MAGTKNYFDQILENQNKLYSSFLNYANTVVETAMPDKNAAEDAGKLLNEYYTRYAELTEKMVDKTNLEKYQKDFFHVLFSFTFVLFKINLNKRWLQSLH